jgi:hypothetical protein
MIKIKKVRISAKFIAILVSVVVIVLLAIFGFQKFSALSKEKKQILSDIEYIYYYLKTEPANLKLIGTLQKGDGVSLSAWENYLSTFDSKIKNINKMIEDDKNKIKKFKEFKETNCFDDLKLAVDKLSLFKDESQKRIEGASSFSEDKLNNIEKDLQNNLIKVKEEAKKLSLDLR